MNNFSHKSTLSTAAQISSPEFAIGESVVLKDTGESVIIMGIHEGVAWVMSNVDGFDTVDFSEMRRPDLTHPITL